MPVISERDVATRHGLTWRLSLPHWMQMSALERARVTRLAEDSGGLWCAPGEARFFDRKAAFRCLQRIRASGQVCDLALLVGGLGALNQVPPKDART